MEQSVLARVGTPEVIVLLVASLLILFLGFKIKKIGFFILFFILGYNLVSNFLPMIYEGFPILKEQQIWQYLLPTAGGLLLGLLSFSIEKFCVSMLVFFFTLTFTIDNFGTATQTIVIGAAIGAVLGGLSSLIIKPAIIIATAIGGSYGVTISIIYFIRMINGDSIDVNLFFYPMLAGIAAVGAIVQFLTTKHD
jgi:hypothetical protein